MAELDDPKRLDRLDVYLTDSASDEKLDEYVAEAARLADAPIALVSLVLRRIQFFRASYGLPQDLEASRATSRCESFCQFVVRDELPFLVQDAPNDERVPQELVTRYGIRAYAGVPLTHRGQVIGSLCVLDLKPRSFDAALVIQMKSLATKVVERLEEMKELSTDREPEALRTPALLALLDGVARDARVLERSLLEIDGALRQAEGFDVQVLAAVIAAPDVALPAEIAALYEEMLEQIDGLRADALRAADAAELRAQRPDDDALATLRISARGLARSLREVSPLVRLLKGFNATSLNVDAFTRNASVLREALDFDKDILATLGGLKEAVTIITASVVASAKAGGSRPPGPRDPAGAEDRAGRPS